MTRKIQLAVMAIIIALDQYLKWLVLQSLPGNPSVPAIPGLLQFTYVENRGAAYGILQNQTWLLSVVTGIVLLAGLVYLLRGAFDAHPMFAWCVTAILGGGIGNFIDRVGRGFVVDYLDIGPLFSFPVFNFADCCLVCGTALLVVYFFLVEPRLVKAKQAPEVPSDTEPTEENHG